MFPLWILYLKSWGHGCERFSSLSNGKTAAYSLHQVYLKLCALATTKNWYILDLLYGWIQEGWDLKHVGDTGFCTALTALHWCWSVRLTAKQSCPVDIQTSWGKGFLWLCSPVSTWLYFSFTVKASHMSSEAALGMLLYKGQEKGWAQSYIFRRFVKTPSFMSYQVLWTWSLWA